MRFIYAKLPSIYKIMRKVSIYNLPITDLYKKGVKFEFLINVMPWHLKIIMFYNIKVYYFSSTNSKFRSACGPDYTAWGDGTKTLP